MQIKEINIINFGKLQNLNIKLNSGINQIIAQNGYGKTTMVDFIKAMLYGLGSGGKSIETNMRLRYAPWNKNTFGGSLICNFDDKDFKIERIFGAKPSQDTLNVYELPSLTPLQIDNVGQYFLGLDEQSFERSVYIAEDMLDIGTNSALIQKITKSFNDTEITNNYENAIKLLDQKRAIYSKTGKRGKIEDCKAELKTHMQNLEICEQNTSRLEQFTSELNAIEEQIKITSEKLNKVEQDYEFASIQNEKQNARKRYLSLLENKQNLVLTYDDLNKKLKNNELNSQDIQEFSLKISELNTCEKFRAQKNEENLKQKTFYEDFAIKKDKISVLLQKAEKKPKSKNKIKMIGTIASIAVFGLGITSFFCLSAILGAIVLILSILPITFSLIYEQKRAKSSQNLDLKELQSLLHTQNNAIAELKNDFSLFVAKNEIYEKNKTEIEQYSQEIKNYKKQLDNYFNKFSLEDCTTYFDKIEKLKKIDTKKQEIQNRLQDYQNQIDMFDKSILDTPDTSVNATELKNQKQDLKNFLSEQNKKQTLLKMQIKDCENKLNDLPFLQFKIAEIQTKIAEYEYDLDIIKKTMNLLEQAKTQISTKFIAPAQTKLNEYTALFDQTKNYSPILLKDDLSFMYEQDGVLRDEHSLSVGLHTSFALLIRFAIANVIFENQKAIFILDDCFHSLDQNNINLMKQILHKISKDNQILYFSCSESRSIK